MEMQPRMQQNAEQSLRVLMHSIVYWLRAVWRVARSSPALFVLQFVLAVQCLLVWGIPFLFTPLNIVATPSYARLAVVAGAGPFAPHVMIGLVFIGVALAYGLAAWRGWRLLRIAMAFVIAVAFSFISKMISDATPGTTGSRNYSLMAFLALWLFASLLYDYLKAPADGRSDDPRRLD